MAFGPSLPHICELTDFTNYVRQLSVIYLLANFMVARCKIEQMQPCLFEVLAVRTHKCLRESGKLTEASI